MNCQMESPVQICEDDESKHSILNNNRLWCVEGDVRPEEMQELGVSILPSGEYMVEEDVCLLRLRNNAQEILTPKDVYCDCDQEDEVEFQKSKKAKTLSPDTFLYTRGISRTNTPSRDIFLKMSDEIVLCIFSHLNHTTLSTVAQVNRRFRRLARDESLWVRYDASGLRLKTNTMGNMLTLGFKVLRMTSASFVSPLFSPGFSAKLIDFKAKLEYLDLSEAVIQVEDLEMLCSKLYNLKKLSLEGCEINTNVLKEVAKNEQLDTLNLTMCTGINEVGMKILASKCRRLISLNLAWTCLNAKSVQELVTLVNPELKQINLSGQQLTVKDRDVMLLVNRCGRITELDISDCLEISSAILNVIVEHLFHLKSLSISRCYKVNPLSLIMLSSLPRLENLNAFHQITRNELPSIESQLPGVRINKELFTTIARPCVGIRRTSIWQIRCRE